MAVGNFLGGPISVPQLYVVLNGNFTNGQSGVVVFNTVIVDSEGWYNVANGRYTPQHAGWYDVAIADTINAGIGFNGTNPTAFRRDPILVNGSTDYITAHVNNVTVTSGSFANGRWPIWMTIRYIG